MPNTNPSDLPANPFIVGPPIKDPRLFVGRKDELNTLINCMDGAQPTSVNIVGERRIGKTSLLYHLERTWAERVRDPDRFVFTVISMQQNNVCKKRGFFNAVARKLLNQPSVSNCPDLVNALSHNSMNGSEFADAMALFEREELLPVLCLDEFEILFKHPKEFDNTFYDGIRSIMDRSRMVIIAASPYPIKAYKQKHSITSTFFNQGRTEYLRGLQEHEIRDLLRLPASTVEGSAPALSDDEQKCAREWSGTDHPFFLQMAAYELCEMRRNEKDKTWARKRFCEKAGEYDRWGLKRPGLLLRCLRMAFVKFPKRIGGLVRKTGTEIDNVTNWIMGWFLIIFLTLIVLGAIKPNELLEIVRKIVRFLRSLGT